jgi:hypothetical protein
MDFANGTRLLAAFPMVAAHSGKSTGIIVCVERTEVDVHHKYVTAWVRELTDTSWTAGSYFVDALEAMTDALDRSGWHGVWYTS